MNFKRIVLALSFFMMQSSLFSQVNLDVNNTNENLYRPDFHFTPRVGWMNDPNGMIFLNGQYHLFYQHYPDSTVWGPMHWGHATSSNMMDWKEQKIALYPDSIGMIFSGSAVLDKENTSGLGRDGIAPLVAIYTQHFMPGEKAGRTDFQNQSIAFSLDEGKTWTKYAKNPVLRTPNLKDFRDPKVIWHQATNKWIMSLAVADHIEFYSSPNLMNWTKESEMGKGLFAHGGVWECPDLLSFKVDGKTIWVLLVSMNPGGPNSGSATQYMVGDFDGHIFKPFSTQTKWMDYGPDNYAGVSFSNTGDRKVLIGWMSNWNYANLVPTEKWRSAMTVPRELTLVKHQVKSNTKSNTNSSSNLNASPTIENQDFLLVSNPVKEMDTRFTKTMFKENFLVQKEYSLVNKSAILPSRIDLDLLKANDFQLILSNAWNEQLLIGFNATKKEFYIDRQNAGVSNFYKGFAALSTAPRFVAGAAMDLSLLIDKTSVELFADGGRTVMTALFFPTHPFTNCSIQSKEGIYIKSLDTFSFK